MTCRACSGSLDALLDLGPQPVTNRYVSDPKQPEAAFPLALAICSSCALVQLKEPMPAAEILPRYDWITYREPEGHLDDLAADLSRLPNMREGAVIAGTTFKDDTLLDRLGRLGSFKCWRLDLKEDLDVENSRAGLETIQERLTPSLARAVAQRRGKADLLLVRHVLEHAYDPRSFAAALKELVKPDGAIVLEVPDNARCFEKLDYGAVWEEHIAYFTPDTFRSTAQGLGLGLAELRVYPYPMENSLVGITGAGKPSALAASQEKDRARRFALGLPAEREKFARLLRDVPRECAAMFGAGHRSAMFLNLLGLKDRLGWVIDDDPNKKGLFMPGSRLPIAGSAALLEKGIKLCLLNLSPESEEKVAAKNTAFTQKGGTFVSVFPDGKYSAEALRKA